MIHEGPYCFPDSVTGNGWSNWVFRSCHDFATVRLRVIFEQGDELISSGVGLEEKRKIYVVREYEEVEIPIST